MGATIVKQGPSGGELLQVTNVTAWCDFLGGHENSLNCLRAAHDFAGTSNRRYRQTVRGALGGSFRQENQTTVKIATFARTADREVRGNESTRGGKLTLPTINLPARRPRYCAGLNTSRHMALPDG
jgi:hypothetical protein